jgi:hypothetical protein
MHHKCWEQLPTEHKPITYETRTCEWCHQDYVRRKGYPVTRYCSRRCAMLKRGHAKKMGKLSAKGRRDAKK